jgi:hypothetical protein
MVPELFFAGTSAGTRVWDNSQSLPHSRLGLEARVGIGRLMPYFQRKITRLSALFQYNPALFDLTRLNPLTEDFTEGFWHLQSREWHS